MGEKLNFFADDPGRYERFQQEFKAQDIIEDALDEIFERHGDALKERDGAERDLLVSLEDSVLERHTKPFRL